MKISVIQEDIDRGKPKRVRMCLVAIAARREGLADAVVFNTRAPGPCIIRTPERDYPLPDWVRDRIRSFDAGESVTPFEFHI